MLAAAGIPTLVQCVLNKLLAKKVAGHGETKIHRRRQPLVASCLICYLQTSHPFYRTEVPRLIKVNTRALPAGARHF
jgi:hypothetical protein